MDKKELKKQKKEEKTSSLVYSYVNELMYKIKGKKVVHKQKILDGSKGIAFKLLILNEKNNKTFYKIEVKQNENNTFTVKEKKGDVESKKESVSKSEIDKLLKDPKFKFVNEYMKKRKSYSLKGGRRSSNKIRVKVKNCFKFKVNKLY